VVAIPCESEAGDAAEGAGSCGDGGFRDGLEDEQRDERALSGEFAGGDATCEHVDVGGDAVACDASDREVRGEDVGDQHVDHAGAVVRVVRDGGRDHGVVQFRG